MAIQKWTKITDASGNISWKKENAIPSANINGSNVVIADPRIVNTPARLDSILGAMKGDIDELFGISKYLAAHGIGSGNGGGSSSGGDDESKSTHLEIRAYNEGTSVLKTIVGPTTNYEGSLSVKTETSSFYIYLVDPKKDLLYYINAYEDGTNTIYASNTNITKTHPIQIDITGLKEGVSKNIIIQLKDNYDDDYNLYNTYLLTVSYTSLKITTYLQDGADLRDISDGNSLQHDALSGYNIHIDFKPTVSGIFHYKVNTSIPGENGNVSFEEDNISILANNTISKDFDLYNSGNFSIGTPYSVDIEAEVKNANGDVIVKNSQAFTAQIIPTGELLWTTTNNQWIDNNSKNYSSNFFSQGSQIKIDGLLFGDNEYSEIYLLIKYYYQSKDNWVEISNLNQGILSSEDGSEYLPIDGYKDVIDKKISLTDWYINHKDAIEKWKTANNNRKTFASTLGNESDFTLQYSDIASYDFTNIGPNQEDGFLNLKAEIYLINVNISQDPSKWVLPFNEDGTKYVPYRTIKTQIKQSSDKYIPDYAKGWEQEDENGNIVKLKADQLYFNLDTLRSTAPVSNVDALNTNNVFDYQTSAAAKAKIHLPLEMVNTNGATSGFINNANLTSVNGVPILAFRASGKGYGHISHENLMKFLGNNYWTSMKSGFTIEIVFKADKHVNNNGTIFSMGDYDSNTGNLSKGINVNLNKAEFIIGSKGIIGKTIDNNNNTISQSTNISLVQGTLYQLDFVFEIDPKSNYTYIDSTGIKKTVSKPAIGLIKIYKNGIPTGMANVELNEVNSLLDVTFGSCANGITLGCKSDLTNFTDVNFYGFRIYKESLTEIDIMKNWMISDAETHRITQNNGNTEVDYDYMNSLLTKNYFNNEWKTKIWDYVKYEQASATKLLDAFTTYNNGKIAMPVMVLRATTDAKGNALKSSDAFYQSYNEATAGIYNKYIENNLSQCYTAGFTYYDSNYSTPITPNSIPYIGVSAGKSGNSAYQIAFFMQGTSTMANYSKNIEIRFQPTDQYLGDYEGANNHNILFTPRKDWLPENRFTLKADVMDSAHANNAALGAWINGTRGGKQFMPLNPAQQDDDNPYKDKVKITLEGFPILVFIDWGQKTTNGEIDTDFQTVNGMQFMGIYSFNLGRGSYFNLGFQRLKRYEVTESPTVPKIVSNTVDDSQDYDASAANYQTHADFVTRYELLPQNKEIYSFECNSNSPADVVGFKQPNIDAIKELWDIKYTSADNDKQDDGYMRLHDIAKGLSYINGDHLNYFGKEDRPEYYYGVNGDIHLNSDNKIGPIPVYRDKENPHIYFFERTGNNNNVTQNEDGTYTLSKYYRESHNIPDASYTNLKYSHLTWEEGLSDPNFENDQFLDDYGNLIKGKSKPDRNQINDYSKFFLDIASTSEAPTIYHPTEHDQSMNSTAPLDKFISSDQLNNARSSWLDYVSFSRYFIIALVFGMVDSLGKNFTLRSWNMTRNGGWLNPAFYDMDTALGLDNQGVEGVDPTVNLDYWMVNNQVNPNKTIVFTESFPYYKSDQTGGLYWYDKDPDTNTDAKIIGHYDSGLLPLPASVQYQITNSHLWHIIRFMPLLLDRTQAQSYITQGGGIEAIQGLAPKGQYAYLRTKFLQVSDDFVNNYYLKQNEDVGAILFTLDYKIKYMKAYISSGSDSTIPLYNDLKFCHGRRDDFVKSWLKSRIDFLDSIFNLGNKYSAGSITDPTQGPDAQMVDNSYFYPSIQGITTQSFTPISTGDKQASYLSDFPNTKAENGGEKDTQLNHVVTSSETVVLVINFGNKFITRHFLRANIPTNIQFTRQSGQSITVKINELNNIYSWDLYRELNLTTLDEPLQLEKLLLNPQSSNTGASSENMIFSNKRNLKVLDLRNFQTTTNNDIVGIDLTSLDKLEEFYMNSNTNISGNIAFPEGGNLTTIDISSSKASGRLYIKNSKLLQYLNISNCKSITEVYIEGCDSLRSIDFTGMTSLEKITINNCKKFESFSYNGYSNKDLTIENSQAPIKNISLLNVPNLHNIDISEITNPDVVLDFSGAIGLTDLSLSNIASMESPIMPIYKNNIDGSRTNYPIYSKDHTMNITINRVNFSAFNLGSNNYSYCKYTINKGEYPKIEYVPYSKSVDTSNLILNVGVFGNTSLNISQSANIRYISFAYKENEINSLTLSQGMSGINRIFGTFNIGNDNTFNYYLSNFYISDWSSQDSTSSLPVKLAYEDAIKNNYSSEKIQAFVDLMHDNDPELKDEDLVQNVRPITRLIIDNNTTKLNNTFRSSNINANDLYYIMLLINKYNYETKALKEMKFTFQNCNNIKTSYSEDADLSLSHWIFKDLYTLTTIEGIFGGDNNIQGILYSPDHDTEHKIIDFTTADYVGTLTPLAVNCKSFKNIGWQLKLTDGYAFWTPGTEDIPVPTYFDSSKTTNGIFDLEEISNMYNNMSGITSAVYGNIDGTEKAIYSDDLLKSFKNTKRIINSFNSLSLNTNNKSFIYNNQTWTYTPILFNSPNIEEIVNSFNDTIDLGGPAFVIDIFGGSKGCLSKYPNNFSKKITNICNSFNFSSPVPKIAGETTTPVFFIYTDDMFQRISDTLLNVSNQNTVYDPKDKKTKFSYSISNFEDPFPIFTGSNCIKTYVKYPSDNTTDYALFPYGIFKNCHNLIQASEFFTSINLRHYVDMSNSSNSNKELTYNMLADGTKFEYDKYKDFSISIPDAYKQKPYNPIKKYNGQISYDADIKMFEDTESLVNLNSAFKNIITPLMYSGEFTIPMGFELTSESFVNCKKLDNLSYAFSNNIFMKGQIPYRFLYFGETSTKKSVNGTNDNTLVKNGFIGLKDIDISNKSIEELKAESDNNTIICNSTTTGLQDLLNKAYSFNDKIYTADDYAPRAITYVIDTSSYATIVDNQYIAKFIPYESKYKNQQRYSLQSLKWYQKFDFNEDDRIGLLETTDVDVSSYIRGISDINHIFYKNTAAGFLYTRYNKDMMNIQGIQNVTQTFNKSVSDKLKLNAFDNNSYKSVNGTYMNDALFMPNDNYNPYTYISNANENTQKLIFSGLYVDLTDEAKVWRYVYDKTISNRRNGYPEKMPDSSEIKEKLNISNSDINTWIQSAFDLAKSQEDNYEVNKNPQLKGEPLYIVNCNYDPRQVLFNDNKNKVTYNKYLADGQTFTDIDRLIEDSSNIILDGLNIQEDKNKVSFIKRHIPKSWTNDNMLVKNPILGTQYDSSIIDQSSGIYHPEKLYYQEESVNEFNSIVSMLNETNYFAPSDIFNYLNDKPTLDITYAFADTTYQIPKVNVSNFNNLIAIDVSAGDMLAESIYDVKDSFEIYPYGNLYTGIPGKVSPYMFEKIPQIMSIEGVFYKNPQLIPYYYSGEVDGNYVPGQLFERDTFKNLTSLTNTYLLWANNIVPRKVDIDKNLFRNNTKVTSLDYMFAGTLWYGYSKDDVDGGQIQRGMFDNMTLYRNNAMFSAPIQYSFIKNTGISPNRISIVSNDPKYINEGEDGDIGKYGIRSIPDDLFDKSSNTLIESNNLLFYDQALTHFPGIWFYKNYKYPGNNNALLLEDWNTRLYHAGYFLNPNIDNADEISNTMSLFGDLNPAGANPDINKNEHANYITYLSNTFDIQLYNK